MYKYKVGQKFYNHGDCCNPEHFAKVVDVIDDTRFNKIHYKLEILDYEKATHGEQFYFIDNYNISIEYKGNASTRIVPIEAYLEYNKEYLK